MSGLLFDTPLLGTLPPVATESNKKRKRATGGGGGGDGDASSSAKDEAARGAELNLDKLMKRMKKMDKDAGWGGQLGGGGKSGNDAPVANEGGKKKKVKKAKGDPGAVGGGGLVAPSPSGPTPFTNATAGSATGGGGGAKRFEPAKKDKRLAAQQKKEKKEAKASFNPLTSANSIQPSFQRQQPVVEPVVVNKAPVRHSAPNFDEEETQGSTVQPKQTSMQTALRAKLAGGKFRMLNETLYTSTGEEAWSTMKEEGAFDDVSNTLFIQQDARLTFVFVQYHAGFRSQAANWPTHPLTLLKTSLSSSLPPQSLIVDFGCGDATLARSLSSSPQNLKVISFDLVSKDGWVIEAECSSVPLPGGKSGGQVVDVVVCCLSLMGTDWVRMIREAWRILKDG